MEGPLTTLTGPGASGRPLFRPKMPSLSSRDWSGCLSAPEMKPGLEQFETGTCSIFLLSLTGWSGLPPWRMSLTLGYPRRLHVSKQAKSTQWTPSPFFSSSGNWTQGLAHAWQVLRELSYIPALFPIVIQGRPTLPRMAPNFWSSDFRLSRRRNYKLASSALTDSGFPLTHSSIHVCITVTWLS